MKNESIDIGELYADLLAESNQQSSESRLSNNHNAANLVYEATQTLERLAPAISYMIDKLDVSGIQHEGADVVSHIEEAYDKLESALKILGY